MNIIQRELREATSDYCAAKRVLRYANRIGGPQAKREAMSYRNSSRGHLMNVVKAANVLLGRCA